MRFVLMKFTDKKVLMVNKYMNIKHSQPIPEITNVVFTIICNFKFCKKYIVEMHID